MAEQFWANDPVAQPKNEGVTFIPNPSAGLAQNADQRDDTRTGIAVEGNERDAGRYDREGNKDEREGMGNLRKEFSALPEVKAYREAVTALDTGLFTKPDGSGDGTLLYQYSKLMDPMGSVREGDVELAKSGAGYLTAKAAQFKKDFNIGSGGSLPDEVREGLRREMIGRFNSLNRSYNQQRQQYGSIAKQANFDPEFVVGEHAGTPFLERFREYDQRHQIGQFAGQSGEGPLGVNPAALPLAKGAHEQGVTPVDGVTPKGEGFRPEPKLYHLGNTVADMVRQGKSASEITEYLDEQYKPYGVEAGAPLQAQIQEVIRLHKSAPNKPIKSLKSGWDSFHLLPDSSETTLLGDVMDSPVGAAALGVADIPTAGFGDEVVGLMYGDEANALWDYSRQERPGPYMAGQLAGAFLLPTGATGAAREAGTTALRSGAGMASARAAASRAGAARMGVEGAAYGTVHGFGAAEGDIEDRLAGAATEGTLGFVGARALGAAGGKLAERARASRTAAPASSEAAEYAAAAGRQEITPYAPDMGDRAAALAGKLAQTQAGVGPITTKAQATIASAKAARDRIAKAVGTPIEGKEGLGYQISTGAQKAIAREHDKGQALYKAAERQSEGVRIKPTEAFQTLSDEIDAMADTGLSETAANVFKRVRDRMAEGPMTVESLRAIRSSIREDLATFNVRGGVSNARAQRVMEAIGKDIDDGLRAQGRGGAADLFQQADGQWASYIDLTDNVVTPLIGKDGSASGEQVTKRMMADLQGNNARAVKLLNALPAEEQAIARASVIQAMGRAAPGRQDAEGAAFSLSEFLTHWDKMGETAKAAYFGRETRAALNDLATVAQGSKSSQRWANHSNSGGAINFPVETAAGIGTLGLSALATNVTARMLTSQRMVRWLAASAKKPNAGAQRAHVERLTAIARAEPAIANDILQLQQRLMEGITRSPAPVYADDKGNGRIEPPQQGASDDRP